MFKHFAILIVFIGLTTFSAHTQNTSFKPMGDTDAKAFTKKAAAASAKLTSLQCNFTQKKNISVLSEVITSKGKLLFKAENMLRWEYTSPYFYLFILNNDKVFLKNDNSSQQFDVKSNKLFKEISSLMVNGIRGDKLIDESKYQVQFFENSSQVMVKLFPKNKEMKSLISAIQLYFNKTTYLVNSLDMNEQSGDVTSIVFTDMVLNQQLSDEKFTVH
jgi:outer membrane lipoprotein-sorting protein